MKLIPIKSPKENAPFDLYKAIIRNIINNNEKLLNGDIIVISSKYVSMSYGRFVKLDEIIPSVKAVKLSERYSIEPKLTELVLREADYILGGIKGVLLAVKDGVLAPNAGIDRSNTLEGTVILYPEKPFEIAKNLRLKIKRNLGINVGIIFNDSRLMPSRMGTVGISIAVSGFEPLKDYRGSKDLFNYELRFTQQAIADSISTAANLLMGEGKEGVPIVIARDFEVEWTNRDLSWHDLAINHDECIFIRSIRDSFNNPI